MLSSRLFLLASLALSACGGTHHDFSEPVDSGADVVVDTGPLVIALGGRCNKPGALACDGSKQQIVCDGSKWVAGGTCGADQICDPSTGSCKGTICKAGASSCEGATLKTCAPDQLSYKTTACLSEEHCKQAVSGVCAKCLAWEVRCEGTKLLKCAPDRQKMIELATCETAGLCSAATSSCLKPVCANGDFRCFGDILEKCAEDRADWEFVKKCAPDMCDAPAKSCRG